MKRALVFIVIGLLLMSVALASYGPKQAPSGSSDSGSSGGSGGGGGGGGGGGSGGGGTSSTSSGVILGQSIKESWKSVAAGGLATATIKDQALGVTEISFVASEQVSDAWIQVTKRISLPNSVSGFSGKVYKNLEITKNAALEKEGAFTEAKIKFKVEKAWLAEHTLPKEAVALFRYSDNSWNQLQTLVGQDDGVYVHYSAKTLGFSYFVIGEKTAAAVPAASAQTGLAVEQPSAEVAEQSAVEAPVADEEAMTAQEGLGRTLLIALLAAVLVVVAVFMYLRQRK